jgi:hypothetical protein
VNPASLVQSEAGPGWASAPGTVWPGLVSAFEEAWIRHPGLQHTFSGVLANTPVRFRVAGEELARHILRPFQHLRVEDTALPESALEIDLWDEEETGCRCPLPGGPFNLGATWHTLDGLFTGSADGRWIGFTYRSSRSLYDRAARRIVGCRGPASHFSRFERSKPLLVFLSIGCHDQGLQLMHAGLVADRGVGVLFPGKGGVGKSTCSLTCLLDGFEYCGDDFIALEERPDGSYHGHSLYSSACLHGHHLEHFPVLGHLAEKNRMPVEDKDTIFLAEFRPEQLRSRVTIQALVMPRIVPGEHTAIRPARPPETLLRLAPSTLRYVVPRPGREAMELMGRLVQRLPAYWLDMGRDLDQIPDRVREVVEEIRAR